MGYNVEAPPYCWYSGLDPQGHILFDCPVPLPKGILMHDMQTTEDYAIIIDSNVEFDPQVMQVLFLFFTSSRSGSGTLLCPAKEACTAAAGHSEAASPFVAAALLLCSGKGPAASCNAWPPALRHGPTPQCSLTAVLDEPPHVCAGSCVLTDPLMGVLTAARGR